MFRLVRALLFALILVGPTASLAPAARAADDPRIGACGAFPATSAQSAQAIPLAHAFNYRRVLPALGFVPALDLLDAPALLLVYGAQSPLRPPIGPIYPPNGGPPIFPVQPPLPIGTSDVCVAVNGVAEPFIYEAIPTAAIHPEFADAQREAPAAGEGRTLARLPDYAYDIAWDASRGLLWTVSVGVTDWKGTLTSIDPKTHAMHSWPLPTTPALRFPSANGSSASIAVDTAGGIWFEVSGYNLYRFDPTTGRFRAQHLELKTGHWRHFGSYVLAIVPFGDGVLVARRGVPILYRYDTSMRVVGSVPLPADYVTSRDVTRAGSNLVIRGTKWLGLFDIDGHRIRQLLFEPNCTAPIGRPTATADDRRRAVVCHGDQLVMLDQNGREIGSVSPPVDPPRDARYSTYTSAFATDWHGRWWYLWDGFVLEVDAA